MRIESISERRWGQVKPRRGRERGLEKWTVSAAFEKTDVCDWMPQAAEKRGMAWYCLGVYSRSASDRLKSEFDNHARKWQIETEDFSILALRFSHASYLRIVGLGHVAIPWLLEELRTDPDWWFEALKAVSAEDPASQCASFDDAVEAWINWGSDRGYA